MRRQSSSGSIEHDIESKNHSGNDECGEKYKLCSICRSKRADSDSYKSGHYHDNYTYQTTTEEYTRLLTLHL